MKQYKFPEEPIDKKIDYKAKKIGEEFSTAGLGSREEVAKWVGRGRKEEGWMMAHEGTLNALKQDRAMIHARFSMALEAIERLIENGVLDRKSTVDEVIEQLMVVINEGESSGYSTGDVNRSIRLVSQLIELTKNNLIPRELTASELPAYLEEQLKHFE